MHIVRSCFLMTCDDKTGISNPYNIRLRFQIILINKQISFLTSLKQLNLPLIGQSNYETSVNLSLFPLRVIYFHTFLKLSLTFMMQIWSLSCSEIHFAPYHKFRS